MERKANAFIYSIVALMLAVAPTCVYAKHHHHKGKTAGEKVDKAADQVHDKAVEVKDTVKEKATEAKDKAVETKDKAKDKIHEATK